MELEVKQFSAQYCKSYKNFENAEKAVKKFMENNSEFFDTIEGRISWIPTLAEDGRRIIPIFKLGSLLNEIPLFIFVEAGFPVMQ